MALFFPFAHAQINWSGGFEFLERFAIAYTVGADLRVAPRIGRAHDYRGPNVFLDWVLWLPEDLGAEFDARMGEYEEIRKMEYVTSTERRGIKKGCAKRRPGA